MYRQAQVTESLMTVGREKEIRDAFAEMIFCNSGSMSMSFVESESALKFQKVFANLEKLFAEEIVTFFSEYSNLKFRSQA